MDDLQVAQVMAVLGRLDERTERIVKIVEGNGQPGLVQRVGDLEGKQNKVIGGVAVLGTLGAGFWGFLEWLFHSKVGH